ncbi:acyltransferase [Mycoplana sp. MJR14]|uniref:acyltransferase n=1 Tax=Mycoplana sp. MJR14 TaxID=3032583 RepID=UPI0023DBFA30|nr:acyltransferase [Mycoplana sp. MJR14]MDF1634411.1 acyltransferase [Mycoplana sp. MJR14]
MWNFGPLAKLRAFFSGGSLKIGKRPKMPYLPRFRYGKGKITIGDRISTRSGVVINAQSGAIQIGDNVSLNDYTVLLGHGGIRIGNDVRIAAHVVMASFEHGYDDVEVPIRRQANVKKPIVVEDDVWIGAGAKILGGAHIAKGCVIGANCVVKGQTVPYGVYVGAPARLVKMRGGSASAKAAAPADIQARRTGYGGAVH